MIHILILLFSFLSPHTYETDDHFYNGEVLMPDFLHSDFRVVVDAAMYDEVNEKCESWDDLYDLVQEFSVPIEDFENNLK